LVLCVDESSPITNRSALNAMGGSLQLPGVITALNRSTWRKYW
jgi:hypothetical protein